MQMKQRRTAQAAIILLFYIQMPPGIAQTPAPTAIDHSPHVTMNAGFPRKQFRAGDVSDIAVPRLARGSAV